MKISTPILARSRETRKSPTGKTGFNQPSLFSSAPAPKAPTLSIERVPQRLAIARTRFYLTSRQGDRFWHYPIQLTKKEATQLLLKLHKLNWALDANGVPFDVQAIHGTVKQAIDGGLL